MGKKLLLIPLVLLLVVSLIACAAPTPTPTPTTTPVETVKIGHIAALTGPAAVWGKTGDDAVKIWVDEVNARGGIDIGGKKYMVELFSYDNKYLPSDTLTAAKKLILDDEVDVILCMAHADVIASFCEEQKILLFTVSAEELNPDYTYLYAAGGGCPEYMSFTMVYCKEELWPSIEKMAITSQDDKGGKTWRVWYAATAELLGMTISYDKPFALETTDFAPVVSAMLATDPDILCWDSSYPAFNALLNEQAWIQGWRGPVLASSWDLATCLGKIGAEGMEGHVDSWPDWDSPLLSEECNRYYDLWCDRYGSDRWAALAPVMYETCRIWEEAAKIAGSVDSAAVKAVIDSGVEFNVALGPASTGWYDGEQVWGIDNHILYKHFPVGQIQNGKNRVKGIVDIEAWWDKYKVDLLKKFAEAGILWYQR